jgi:hypothetical protein
MIFKYMSGYKIGPISSSHCPKLMATSVLSLQAKMEKVETPQALVQWALSAPLSCACSTTMGE